MKDAIELQVCAALFESDLIATRVLLGIAEFLWAVMLFWPGMSFERPVYRFLAVVMQEDWWGAVFFLTSVVQAYIVATGRIHGFYPRMFALWSALLWSFVVVSMLLAVYPPPAATAGEVALTFGAIWIYVRPVMISHWFRKAYARATIQHG